MKPPFSEADLALVREAGVRGVVLPKVEHEQVDRPVVLKAKSIVERAPR